MTDPNQSDPLGLNHADLKPDLTDELKAIRGQTQAPEAETNHPLERQVPALFQGRLPADMEDKIGAPYALGVNQSEPDSKETAETFIGTYQGVPTTKIGLDRRFILFDTSTEKDSIYDALTEGYYGVGGGFIVAFPVLGQEGASPAAIVSEATYDIAQPANLLKEVEVDGQSDEVVTPRYIAGFVDDKDIWHRNQNFMESDVLKLN